MKAKTNYTKKELQNLINLGAAVDVSSGGRERIPGQVETIGRSYGIYGVTGKLCQNDRGQLFVAFGSAIYTLPM